MNTFPPPDVSTYRPSQSAFAYNFRRILLAVPLIVGVVVIAGKLTGDETPYVAPVVIKPTAPMVLKPFRPNVQTCFGEVTTVLQMEAIRENGIPIPIPFIDDPELPNTDDHYYVTAPVSAELCLQGAIEATTTADALTFTIDQSRDIILNRPAIKASCDVPGDSDCLSISGNQSNGSVIIGLLPFTSSDDPNLIPMALRTAEVQGSDPSCLEQAMMQPGLSLGDLIATALTQEAADQGIPQPVVINMTDADGAPTTAWDARPQRMIFDSNKRKILGAMPDNYDVSFATECDFSQFGIGISPTEMSTNTTPSTTVVTDTINPATDTTLEGQ